MTNSLNQRYMVKVVDDVVVCCDWVLMRIIYRFHTSIYGKLKRRVLLCVCVHISPEIVQFLSTLLVRGVVLR